MTEKYNTLREKARELQRKLAQNDKATFLDDIKLKINDFFETKLGKKNKHILKEFNLKILEMASEDIEKKKFTSLMDSFSSVERGQEDGSSEASRRLANKFEHLMKRSDTYSSKNSNENIARIVQKTN